MLSRTTFRCLRSSSVLSATKATASATTGRACLHHDSSGSQFRATPPEIPPQQHTTPPQPSVATEASKLRQQHQAEEHDSAEPVSQISPSKTPAPPSFTTPLTLTPHLTTLLPQLSSQPSHYVTAHLHGRPYLLTAGDSLRLPFLMPSVEPGDIIRLNRASVLGSRDFSLKGTPYLDERLFECRLRVLGTESEPLRVMEKTKRRRRHVKRVTSKHRYTMLRVMEVRVKDVEELIQEEGAKVVNEE